MDFYQFCEHCGRRVSEKTYKEHRRLYFHDGKWLFVKHAEVEEISHHSDSTPLSISLPPESIGGDSSDFSNAVSIMDDAFDDGTCVHGNSHRTYAYYSFWVLNTSYIKFW